MSLIYVYVCIQPLYSYISWGISKNSTMWSTLNNLLEFLWYNENKFKYNKYWDVKPSILILVSA